MENSDTRKLLQECDAGAKMAVTSIDEVLEKVCDSDMKHLLQESKSIMRNWGTKFILCWTAVIRMKKIRPPWQRGCHG